jgi:hypothetical protein
VEFLEVRKPAELYGFSSSRTSQPKILPEQKSSPNLPTVKFGLAMLVVDIARLKPHKRRRWKFLVDKRFDLLVR